MSIRLIDYLKAKGITTLLSTLTAGGDAAEKTELHISSMIDTWLLLRNIEASGERNRGLYILKSRGMPHSNQIRELKLTNHGIELLDVYLGPEGLLTGSARVSQEAKTRALETDRLQGTRRRRVEIETERKALTAQLAAVEARIAVHEEELATLNSEETARSERRDTEREAMAKSRSADALSPSLPAALKRKGRS